MIPKQRNIQLPLLKVLADAPDGLPYKEAIEKVETFYPEITDEDRRKRTTSGDLWWQNRVAWVRQELVTLGDLDTDAPRGTWKISSQGMKRVKAEWKSWKPVYSTKTKPRTAKAAKATKTTGLASAENPAEGLDVAYEAIVAHAKVKLLEKIMALPPASVEEMMSFLLEKLGYGDKSTGTLKVTKQSNDGGVDILCSRDMLGVEKIVVQVKRWKDTVGRPEIQKLEGVRSGSRAAYAIFITTSSFSAGAIEEAKRSNIELIDGDRLAEICLKHEIGVENRQLAIPRIDEDFFERL